MKQFYPGCLFFLLLFCLGNVFTGKAQSGTTLQATYTTTESRCRSTGTITVTATGGSGNYNYKATGPVTTPFTSSKTISGLEAGTYTVTVKDVSSGRELQLSNVVIIGTYADPRFVLSATDVTCAGNDGTITTGTVQHGRAPFTYTIVAPSPAAVGTTNNTGAFSHLPAGEYAIRMTDSCGGIQVRTVRIEAYNWWFDGASLTRVGCNEGDATITLKNNKGQTNASGTAFAGFMYGVVQSPGDTVWSNQRTFRFQLDKRRSVTLVSKDPCGNITPYMVAIPAATKPAMAASVGVSDRQCATFDATATGQQNLINPQYCLYDNNNIQVACNSTGLFNNITYGAYTMHIRDTCYDTTIVRSFSAYPLTPAVGSTVNISNRNCTTFTATITGQSNLFNAQYCIYNSSNVQLECNATGVFHNLPYGTYTINTTDGCTGAVIARTVTAARLLPVINNVTISGAVCTGFNVQPGSTTNVGSGAQYCIYDNAGNLIACNGTGQFNNLPYGSYCMKVTTACGDESAPYCFSRSAPVPAVGATVTVDNKTCNTFRATITGQSNLTNPQYCIYNSSNVQLECNSTGVFSNLPYGTYTINTTDGCNGAMITRTVSASQPQPALNASVGISNTTCASFTATIGGTNLTAPVYSVYDAANNLVASGSSNVFANLPYGAYCFEAVDGCTGAVLRVCQTVTNAQTFSITSVKACNIGTTNLQVQFHGSGAPYHVSVYHPDGTLVASLNASSATVAINNVPALPAGAVYTVHGTNSCGQTAQTTIAPEATIIIKTAGVQQRCPGAQAQYGSGDLTVTASSNYAAVTPAIIAKDGTAFSKNFSTNSGATFVFGQLLPGTYVVEYSLAGCSSKVWDTVSVDPYTYPSQDRSAIYQCDNNGFSLGASVTGGVGPYQYEIIGSTPQTPSIVTAPQSSPVFNINTGTVYSLVRLRTLDACGNGTLNDVSVLPLQNIAIAASQTCLYQSVQLTVDTIPNATYTWYLKQTATDSTLVGNNIGHNIPFLRPEETGTYVCKVSVNNGCVTQLATFNLTGHCNDQTLAVQVQLEGRRNGNASVLSWQAQGEQEVRWYIIERKESGGNFVPLDTIAAHRSLHQELYHYTEKSSSNLAAYYRLRIVDVQGKTLYSNTVLITNEATSVTVKPNPVQQVLYINRGKDLNDAYKLEWYTAAGHLACRYTAPAQSNQTLVVPRPAAIRRGMYLLHCINQRTGGRQVFKLMFE